MMLGALPSGTALRRGSSGPAVKALQSSLASRASIGSLEPWWSRQVKVAVDGNFGPQTEEAVRAFQTKRGLTADGVVGADTAAALGISLTSPSSSIAGGISWPIILLGVGAVGAVAWLATKTKIGRRAARRLRFANPRRGRGGRADRRAAKFYEDFHWGRKPRRMRRVRLSAVPRRLVKLGVLEAVTYSAKKGADALADYIHHFGEGGTRKPTLAADPVTKRLHIVGGGYDVRKEGITG
jgi:putative peptidoglycan binding protein